MLDAGSIAFGRSDQAGVSFRTGQIIDHISAGVLVIDPAELQDQEAIESAAEHHPSWWAIASQVPTELRQREAYLFVCWTRANRARRVKAEQMDLPLGVSGAKVLGAGLTS